MGEMLVVAGGREKKKIVVIHVEVREGSIAQSIETNPPKLWNKRR
ncbi:MAG: hypothetical protein Devi2KO_40730 [Devosia indica]